MRTSVYTNKKNVTKVSVNLDLEEAKAIATGDKPTLSTAVKQIKEIVKEK